MAEKQKPLAVSASDIQTMAQRVARLRKQRQDTQDAINAGQATLQTCSAELASAEAEYHKATQDFINTPFIQSGIKGDRPS